MFPPFVYKQTNKKRVISLPALNKEGHVSKHRDPFPFSFLEYSANFFLSSLASGPAKECLFFELPLGFLPS
jgi:hypothetical protein